MIPERVRERFWTNVAVAVDEECWIWRLSTNRQGYGQITWMENGERFCKKAHRIAWELVNGEIPGDLTIDHMCRTRNCVNPRHLRLLTASENSKDMRPRMGGNNGRWLWTHCPRRHKFDKANTWRSPSTGKRMCLGCRALRRNRSQLTCA